MHSPSCRKGLFVCELVSYSHDQFRDKRTCPVLALTGICLCRTGNARVDISDGVLVTEDLGAAGVDNCFLSANLSVISVDCNTVKLDLPETLYRVRVKMKAGTPRAVLTALPVSTGEYTKSPLYRLLSLPPMMSSGFESAKAIPNTGSGSCPSLTNFSKTVDVLNGERELNPIPSMPSAPKLVAL